MQVRGQATCAPSDPNAFGAQALPVATQLPGSLWLRVGGVEVPAKPGGVMGNSLHWLLRTHLAHFTGHTFGCK